MENDQASHPNRRIYLDTNVIGLVRDKKLCLPAANITYVFSSEHLTEFARGNEHTTLLDTLAVLRAHEISVDLDDRFRILNSAQISPIPDLHQRFFEHAERMNRATEHLDLFHQYLGRIWGADNESALSKAVADLPSNIRRLVGETDDDPLVMKAEAVSSSLLDVVAQIGPDAARRFRLASGIDPKIIGNYEAKDAVLRIWNLMAPHLPGTTVDQLFCKKPADLQGYDEWPNYLAVIGCYEMLNSIGYHADTKIKNPRGTARTLSDGTHLANAAFCDAFLTADHRLAWKGKAVFSFLECGTAMLILEES